MWLEWIVAASSDITPEAVSDITPEALSSQLHAAWLAAFLPRHPVCQWLWSEMRDTPLVI